MSWRYISNVCHGETEYGVHGNSVVYNKKIITCFKINTTCYMQVLTVDFKIFCVLLAVSVVVRMPERRDKKEMKEPQARGKVI